MSTNQDRENLAGFTREILLLLKNGHIKKSLALSLIEELTHKSTQSSAIAIVGMSCRFPGADTSIDFWRNLKAGRSHIGEFPEGRRKDTNRFLPQGQAPEGGYDFGGYLQEIDQFDPSIFRLSPREARLMHPAQRLFLETAWRALEDAGLGGRSIVGSNTGVFVGQEHTSYSPAGFTAEFKDFMSEADMLGLTGNTSGIVASRISYIFDLRGPAMIIDTACSSGLVALHCAIRSLRARECDVAIAGAVQVRIAPVRFGGLMVESSLPEIRPFDHGAQGTVWGEGVCALILKPLSEALRQRDSIYAVLRGSALNNDGASNGITAPSAGAQTRLLTQAWKDAGVSPENIRYSFPENVSGFCSSHC